jgi:hypothetical protein
VATSAAAYAVIVPPIFALNSANLAMAMLRARQECVAVDGVDTHALTAYTEDGQQKQRTSLC